jgi:5-methylcytosine-specific restriction endonuclease McrA
MECVKQKGIERENHMYICKICQHEFTEPKLVDGIQYALFIINGKNAQCPNCMSVVIASATNYTAFQR